MSVSRIALDNQLNADFLRRWIHEAEQAAAPPAFMSLVLSAASTSAGPERGPLAGRRGRTGIDVLRPG